MSRIPYTKTIKTFDEQIEILKSRGLQFNDEMRAKQLLQNISYYRMSGYWYPLLADKQNHIFKSGALVKSIVVNLVEDIM
jgi:abortive infection bacteriophage resistance protein